MNFSSSKFWFIIFKRNSYQLRNENIQSFASVLTLTLSLSDRNVVCLQPKLMKSLTWEDAHYLNGQLKIIWFFPSEEQHGCLKTTQELWKGRKLYIPPTILMPRAWAVDVQAIQVLYRRMAQKVDPQVCWTGDTENKYYSEIVYFSSAPVDLEFSVL